VRPLVDRMRCVRVAQPVDRCGGVDAGALGRLLDDENVGEVRQWAAVRGRRRIAAAGKDGDRRGDPYLSALTACASPLSRGMSGPHVKPTNSGTPRGRGFR
jgi:hypothetical protein